MTLSGVWSPIVGAPVQFVNELMYGAGYPLPYDAWLTSLYVSGYVYETPSLVARPLTVLRAYFSGPLTSPIHAARNNNVVLSPNTSDEPWEVQGLNQNGDAISRQWKPGEIMLSANTLYNLTLFARDNFVASDTLYVYFEWTYVRR